MFLDPVLSKQACTRVVELWPPTVDTIVSLSSYGAPFAVALAYWAHRVSGFAGKVRFLKAESWSSDSFSIPVAELEGRVVALCDDLLSTGFNAYRAVTYMEPICEIPMLVVVYYNSKYPQHKYLDLLLQRDSPKIYSLC